MKSVFNEIKQVTWPSYKQNLKDTWTVVVSSVLFASYMGLLDWAFSCLTGKL